MDKKTRIEILENLKTIIETIEREDGREDEPINEEAKFDINEYNDGEHFFYNGIEFLRLGEEQGGVMCITAQIWKSLPFDDNDCNNYKKSSVKVELENNFLSMLNENDLKSFDLDLTADNGDDSYGKCTVKVGLLTCDLFRKYRKKISFSEWIWTCTPCCCSSLASIVRGVCTDGGLHYGYANHCAGVVPVCVFKN